MAKTDIDEGFARDLTKLHDVDHDALIILGAALMKPVLEEKNPSKRRKLEKSAETTMKALSYAHRCLLACIDKNDQSILLSDDVASRGHTAQTAAWLIEAHEKRLGLRSMAKLLSDLVTFARVCAPDADIAFLLMQKRSFARRAKRAEKNKKDYAIAPSKLPHQFEVLYNRLAASGEPENQYQGGEFRRLLGAQKLAGVDIEALDVSFLGTPAAIANFESAVPAGKSLGQRITRSAA